MFEPIHINIEQFKENVWYKYPGTDFKTRAIIQFILMSQNMTLNGLNLSEFRALVEISILIKLPFCLTS